VVSALGAGNQEQALTVLQRLEVEAARTEFNLFGPGIGFGLTIAVTGLARGEGQEQAEGD
jgi:hypothetical protein